MSRLLVACALGVAALDLDEGESTLLDDDVFPRHEVPALGLPLLVAADRVGSRIAAVIGRRPPLLLSDDAGTTWREHGGGLPAGIDVAIDPDMPDTIAFATDTRVYLSRTGGVFWESLESELPEITAIRWE
jgi:hypothetical protein